MAEIRITAGDNLRDVFQKAIALAEKDNNPVEFTFNGVKCIANTNTNIDDELKRYHMKLAEQQDALLSKISTQTSKLK